MCTRLPRNERHVVASDRDRGSGRATTRRSQCAHSPATAMQAARKANPKDRTCTQRRSGRGVGRVAALQALGNVVVVHGGDANNRKPASRAELVNAQRKLQSVEESPRVPAHRKASQLRGRHRVNLGRYVPWDVAEHVRRNIRKACCARHRHFGAAYLRIAFRARLIRIPHVLRPGLQHRTL